MNIELVVFLRGAIETLNYFSDQLKKSIEILGYKCISHDLFEGPESLLPQLISDHTLIITFNCIGMSGETTYEQNRTSIWSQFRPKIVNILVDHPMYYHDQMKNLSQYCTRPEDVTILCIDRNHLAYLKEYYPEVHHAEFMTLAGSGSNYAMDYDQKKYDIIFTGNFTPPSHFHQYINRNGKEYADFYWEIIDDLLADPSQPIEKVCIRHIKDSLPFASPVEIRLVLSKMIFIDLYVRFTLRGNVIQQVADAGLNLRLIGKGFEAISCPSGRCLKSTELMPTEFCLSEIAASKISLNIMPLFVNGSHDRILSSMHANSLVVTDPSIWLTEEFLPGEDLFFYDNRHPEQLPSLLQELLENPEILRNNSLRAQKKALEFHSWNSRAQYILSVIQ